MEKDNVYENIKKKMRENQAFERFIIRAEFKIERFLIRYPDIELGEVPIQISKMNGILTRITPEEKKMIEEYLSHKYSEELNCDEVVLKKQIFGFFSLRRFGKFL